MIYQDDDQEIKILEQRIQDLARRDQRWRTWIHIPVVAFALGAPLFVGMVAVLFNLGVSGINLQSESGNESSSLVSRDYVALEDQVGQMMTFGFATCLVAGVIIFGTAFRHGAVKGRLRRAEAEHARLISKSSR